MTLFSINAICDTRKNYTVRDTTSTQIDLFSFCTSCEVLGNFYAA